MKKPFILPRLKTIRPGFLRLPIVGKHIALILLKKHFPVKGFTRHGYIVAKSGSGKSELLKIIMLVIKSVWSWWEMKHRVCPKRSFLLLDPHGDVAWECARQQFFHTDFLHAKHLGHSPDLVLISHSLDTAWRPSLNPFDLTGKTYGNRQLEVLAQNLTSAFATMLGEGDSTLTMNMRTILTPLFLVLLTMASRKHATPTFFDLERFLDDHHNAELVVYGSTELTGRGQRHFFQHLFLDRRFTTTKFALRIRLASFLNSQLFVDLLCAERSSWDLETLMNQGKTIIVDASKSHLGEMVSEIYGRTITALVQSYAFLRGGQAHKTPTFFVIDESANFISEDIKTILSESRKFGLHVLLVNQIIKQGGVSSEFHDTIMGNTALKIIGNAGVTTRRTMARECDTLPDHFRGLRVGTFLVKSDVATPFLLKLPTYWLGTRGCMTSAHWKELRADLLTRYYQKHDPNPPAEHLEGDHLRDEMIADRIRRHPSSPLHIGTARPHIFLTTK